MTRPRRAETPLLTTRRAVTVVLLCTSLAIVFLAQKSFSRPAAWRWAAEQPAAPATDTPPSDEPRKPGLAQLAELTRASLLIGHATSPLPTPGSLGLGECAGWTSEYVPLTQDQPTTARRAPYPDRKLLAGAADGDAFLYAPNDAPPELQASAKAAADARARYHLLQLAQDATPGALEADARPLRYESLRQKPDDHRGELVTITGTLVSLAQPMELHGKLPGLDICYLGHIVGERPEHRYLVLFTELPEQLTHNQKDWNQLYIPGVTFTGYSYKVARFTQPTGKRRDWTLPVLVGKTPALPPIVADNNWSIVLTIFAIMAVPVLLITLVLPSIFRRAELRHGLLMARIRARHDDRIRAGLVPLEEPPAAQPTSTGSDQINRLREGLSPTEWN